MSKSIFVVVLTVGVVGITPAITDAAATSAASTDKVKGYSKSQPLKGDAEKRIGAYSGANHSSSYDGNWGYAPGGYIWNSDDRWRRSRGFWDTNSPACPFRYC